MPPLVHFVGSAASKRHVRTQFVVPELEVLQFLAHLLAADGDQDNSRTERLHGQDETLHHGNAAVLAHGSEPRLDASAFAPTLEAATPELRPLVADQVLAGEALANQAVGSAERS